jgi:hypothetical protein
LIARFLHSEIQNFPTRALRFSCALSAALTVLIERDNIPRSGSASEAELPRTQSSKIKEFAALLAEGKNARTSLAHAIFCVRWN